MNPGLARGVAAGALVGATWKTLDIMTKYFREQGKNFIIREDSQQFPIYRKRRRM